MLQRLLIYLSTKLLYHYTNHNCPRPDEIVYVISITTSLFDITHTKSQLLKTYHKSNFNKTSLSRPFPKTHSNPRLVIILSEKQIVSETYTKNSEIYTFAPPLKIQARFIAQAKCGTSLNHTQFNSTKVTLVLAFAYVISLSPGLIEQGGKLYKVSREH